MHHFAKYYDSRKLSWCVKIKNLWSNHCRKSYEKVAYLEKQPTQDLHTETFKAISIITDFIFKDAATKLKYEYMRTEIGKICSVDSED